MHTRLTVSFSAGVFDPITTRDPTDNTKLVYTETVKGSQGPYYQTGVDPLSPQAVFQGCERETYFGPNYWNNSGRPTVYYTDALGNVSMSGGDAQHPIKQVVSAVNSTKADFFKVPSTYCGNGIHAPN